MSECCVACGGKGGTISGPCFDCYGTGCAHPNPCPRSPVSPHAPENGPPVFPRIDAQHEGEASTPDEGYEGCMKYGSEVE